MKVIGGYDVMTDAILVAFRDGHGDYATHGGNVGEDGQIVYSPMDFKDLNPKGKITLRLSSDEARALCALLVNKGFAPEAIDDLTPTKAHLVDAVLVRDRLLAIVERKP